VIEFMECNFFPVHSMDYSTLRASFPTSRTALSFSVLFSIAQLAGATSVSVTVNDAAGAPVSDAIVYVEAAAGQVLPKIAKAAQIEQKSRKFVPLVTVVQIGSAISFPNNDTVRHHVYSFSGTKTFELKLYSGMPSEPILFDKLGTVVVGCNIHDQMTAYIHVVNTPYFARTDSRGLARIDGLAAGKYKVKTWFYKTPSDAQISEQPLIVAGADLNAVFKFNTQAAAIPAPEK
jgi:plastocyanin